MNNDERIKICPITQNELELKIKWYNNPEIRKYLHYTELFELEKTRLWFNNLQNDKTRDEYIIRYDNIPVGIIGLFDIDYVNLKAGFYITIGSLDFQNKGIAQKSTTKFLKMMFKKYSLNKIYLYTDENNKKAQHIYEKVGFKLEGILREELFYNKKFITRYYYGILKDEMS